MSTTPSVDGAITLLQAFDGRMTVAQLIMFLTVAQHPGQCAADYGARLFGAGAPGQKRAARLLHDLGSVGRRSAGGWCLVDWQPVEGHGRRKCFHLTEHGHQLMAGISNWA